MTAFILRRIFWAIPVILAVLVTNFMLIHLVPGDPVTALIGDFPAPEAYVQELRARFGLDQPLWMQLYLYITNLFQGDLGYSFFNRLPVAEVLGERTWNTLALMVPVIILSSIIGILLGILAAVQRSAWMDVLITSLSLAGKSMPVFWTGQVMIIIFAVNLQMLPAQGMQNVRGAPEGMAQVWDFLRHWLMPGLVAIAFNFVVVARVARVSFKEAMNQDFVTTGVAAGLSRKRILFRHILPNASIPIITVIGNNLSNILTGTIMVEAVFGWPGIGELFMSSIAARDYPVIQGVFLLVAIATILANLLTDVLYAIVDPRVRNNYVYGQ